MNRILIFLFCVLTGALYAQPRLARKCFVEMPDSLCPLLTEVNRADCIDFLDSKMKAQVTNRLGGKSEMTALTDDYICMQMTPQSSWQMKLLTVNDSTQVICTVSTACAPACDSHIRFYSTDWEELSVDSFLSVLPVKNNFIGARPDTMSVYDYQDACRQADILLMKADLSPSEPVLTFTFTTPTYMEKEVARRLETFVISPLTYRWQEGKFVSVKETLESRIF